MSNLLFSLNIVLPIFLLILMGFLLKNRGLLTPEFRSKATTLVFYYSLPATLFLDVSSSDIRSAFHARFVLYAVISSLLVFGLAWFLSLRFLKDRSQISATVHGSFRGNFAYVGLAVCHSLVSSENLTAAVMVITFVIPLYNVLAILVLSYYDPSGKKPSGKEILLSLIKNPLILAILLGIPFSLFRIGIPTVFEKTLSYLGQLATPLALLLIGANLMPETFTKKPRGIFLATCIKIVAAPLLFTLLALPFGFSPEELATLFTLHAVPSAVNSYIMTERMGGDAELGAGIVMATSLFSVITLTIGIFLLKTFGLV